MPEEVIPQGFIAKVPLTLKAPTPKAGHAQQINKSGDDIRVRRLDLGLRQKEVAHRLGTTVETVRNWEHGRAAPR